MLWNNYFLNRNVTPGFYKEVVLSPFLKSVLTAKDSKVLDLGCGFGQDLRALAANGFNNIYGVDVSDEAVNYCQSEKLPVHKIKSLELFFQENSLGKFDVVLMSHVLEHLSKDRIISTLMGIRDNLLNKNGVLIIRVPNAQANTGCYWAYEDFTHATLFTTGSLGFVLKAAGFEKIDFVDLDGFEYTRVLFKYPRKILLWLYKLNVNFWNLVTASSFHRQSPISFAYEIKVIASNSSKE